MRYLMISLIHAFLVNSLLLSSVHGEPNKCKKITSKWPSLRVKEYLFCDYDDTERPGHNNGNATTVLFGMVPRSANFDESSGNLQIHSLIYFSWVDERLVWDPPSFENVTRLYIPSYRIWTPDIIGHSPGSENSNQNSIDSPHCNLHWRDGTVTCISPISYEMRCQTDFTLWPFDRQNCTLGLGSWSHTGNEIAFKDVMYPPVHMDYFISNEEWTIRVPRILYHNKTSHYYQNSTTPILLIDFILDRVHNRMSGVYVTPGIIMIIMTMTTLWLDPGSIERLALASLNPVIHLICIQNLHWTLPHNGPALPHILRFYINSFILVTLALILTIFLCKIQTIQKTPPKLISWLTALILGNKTGHVLVFSMLDPKASAGIVNDADDTDNLMISRTIKPAWRNVTILLGWIFFISFFFAYVIMYFVLMPNSSMKPPIDAGAFLYI